MSLADALIKHEDSVLGTRYLGAIALSCLLYDHLLHFDEEVADIWLNFRQRTWLKLMFLLGRYTTAVFVIHSTAITGGFNFNMDIQDCQNYVIVAAVFSGIPLIGTEGVVIYRMRSLWESNRHVNRAITAMFIAVLVSMIISIVFDIVRVPDLFKILPGYPQCLFIDTDPAPFPYTLLVAAVLVTWDIFNICIFTLNTFASPYRCSADILKRFRRDGGRYFLCLFAIHSLHLFMTAFGRDYRLSTIPLVFALSVIVNSRIFHGIGREMDHETNAFKFNLI